MFNDCFHYGLQQMDIKTIYFVLIENYSNPIVVLNHWGDWETINYVGKKIIKFYIIFKQGEKCRKWKMPVTVNAD